MRRRNPFAHRFTFPLAGVLCLTGLFLPGCGDKAAPGTAKNAVSETPLQLVQADLVSVTRSGLATGPTITGSIQAEKKADLRAEVGAVVLAVLKDNGDSVRKGDLLVRLDDTAIRDAMASAQASARASADAYDQAERQYQRLKQLQERGLVAVQQAEDAEVRRNAAHSDAEAAKARLVTARQQLDRTQVRAPFDGILSERKVSAGDTVQVGRELVKVIDPRSLRFEGYVPAGGIGEVRVGQSVVFRVQGLADGQFPGVVSRVNPEADAATRQVGLLVTFTDAARKPTVSGLYAEGRIETARSDVLALPPEAIQRDGDTSFVWKREGKSLKKAVVTLGARDLRSGLQAITGGLAEGSEVLRHPDSTLHDGQPVEVVPPPRSAGA